MAVPLISMAARLQAIMNDPGKTLPVKQYRNVRNVDTLHNKRLLPATRPTHYKIGPAVMSFVRWVNLS